MNRSFQSGHLGNDPEIFFSGEGNPVATFSFAFQSGFKKDNTSWIKVVAFKKTAEICEKYLHKGAKVLVAGELQQKNWKTEDGQSRSSYELIANSIEFIKTDGRGFENNQNDTPF